MEKPSRNRNLFDDDSDDDGEYQVGATGGDAKPEEAQPAATEQPVAAESTDAQTAQNDNILAEEPAAEYQPYQEEEYVPPQDGGQQDY